MRDGRKEGTNEEPGSWVVGGKKVSTREEMKGEGGSDAPVEVEQRGGELPHEKAGSVVAEEGALERRRKGWRGERSQNREDDRLYRFEDTDESSRRRERKQRDTRLLKETR